MLGTLPGPWPPVPPPRPASGPGSPALCSSASCPGRAGLRFQLHPPWELQDYGEETRLLPGLPPWRDPRGVWLAPGGSSASGGPQDVLGNHELDGHRRGRPARGQVHTHLHGACRGWAWKDPRACLPVPAAFTRLDRPRFYAGRQLFPFFGASSAEVAAGKLVSRPTWRPSENPRPATGHLL